MTRDIFKIQNNFTGVVTSCMSDDQKILMSKMAECIITLFKTKRDISDIKTKLNICKKF